MKNAEIDLEGFRYPFCNTVWSNDRNRSDAMLKDIKTFIIYCFAIYGAYALLQEGWIWFVFNFAYRGEV